MPKDNYKNVLVIVVGFSLLSIPFKAPWLVSVSMGIGLVSLLSTKAADIIVQYWFKLAKVLGFINSRILLSVIYYLFLVPMAFASRLSKNRSLQLNKKEGSYFVDRNHSYTKSDLEKPW